jgi:DNA-binding protein YbaB
MENKSKFLLETDGEDVSVKISGDKEILMAGLASALLSEEGDQIFEILAAAMLLAKTSKEKKKKRNKTWKR